LRITGDVSPRLGAAKSAYRGWHDSVEGSRRREPEVQKADFAAGGSLRRPRGSLGQPRHLLYDIEKRLSRGGPMRHSTKERRADLGLEIFDL
jgi:hypothetical protein